MPARALSALLQELRRIAAVAQADVTDRELLQRFAGQGDQGAFAALVGRHGPMVWGVCRRSLTDPRDAEDVFQATFLVLARRARQVRWHSGVGGWLHETARRLAARVRADLRRRAVREQEAGTLAHSTPRPPPAACQELAVALDEELGRLPERVRAAVVLCHLEGRSQDEAARQLGCSVRTVKRRLAEGRRLLRERLTRRGITLSAALLAAGLADPASAALPHLLAMDTAQGAATFAMRGAASSARAVELASGFLRAAALAKVKVLALVALIVGAVGGMAAAGAFLPQRPAEERRPGAFIAANGAAAVLRDRHGDPLPAGAVARLGTERFHHEGDAVAVAYSSDGRLLAAASRNGPLVLWDAVTGREVHRLIDAGTAAESDRPYAIAFSPDGRTLASYGDAGALQLWDAVTGRRRRTVRVRGQTRWASRIGSIAFSPDGKLLAVPVCSFARRHDHRLQEARRVALLDAATGREVISLEMEWETQPVTLAFSSDGTMLATGGDGLVRLWRVSGRELVCRIDGHESDGMVLGLGFSPDGRTLASGSRTRVILSAVPSGREVRRLPAPDGHVLFAGFTPDGRSLVSYDQGARLRTWDVASGALRRAVNTGLAAGRSAALSPDGRTVALGSAWAVVALWDVATGKRSPAGSDGLDAAVQSVAFSPDDRLLATGGDKAPTWLWDVRAGTSVRSLAAGAHRLAFSPDGRTVATLGPYASAIRLWEAASGREQRTLQKDALELDAIAFAPDGREVIALHQGDGNQRGGPPASLQIWDPATGKHLRACPCPGLPAHSFFEDRFALAPDGRTAALPTTGGPILLDDIRLGRPGAVLTGHKDRVNGVVFLPGGARLASGGQDGTVRLWEAATGRTAAVLEGGQRPVQAVAVAPDGRLPASTDGDIASSAEGGEGPTIRLWDVATGRFLRRFSGQASVMTCLAFSPNGRLLVSGFRNGTALLWDMQPFLSGQAPPRLTPDSPAGP